MSRSAAARQQHKLRSTRSKAEHRAAEVEAAETRIEELAAQAAYRGAYERGWRNSLSESASLDRADSRGEPDAWYDGYHDAASGREKWHLRDCIGCAEHPAEVEPENQGE